MATCYYKANSKDFVCKKMLHWQKFASATEVQKEFCQWHKQQPGSFFASGIQKIVDK